MYDEEYFEKIAYSKDVIEFVTVAKEYCTMVEGNASMDAKKFFATMQKMLPLLYLKTSMLPTIDDDAVDEPAEKFVSEVDYNLLLNRLSEKFDKHDSYQEVFVNGMQFSENPLEASIAEDICDIYQDLKDFIMNYRIGSAKTMTCALWECKSNFEQYWGQKLVNGLRAIHKLIYSGEEIA